MSDFMTDAQELLSSDEFASLQSLAVKVAQNQSTATEDEAFFNLKDQVRLAVAQRDKEKNLQFLSGGHFTIGEVIRVMFKGKDAGEVRKEVNKGFKEAFPIAGGSAKEAVHIADYKIGDKVHPLVMFAGVAGRNDELKVAVEKGGVAGLVKHLTADGKKWITAFTTPEKGPYAGKPTYKNLGDVATKYKWNASDLKKALAIKD